MSHAKIRNMEEFAALSGISRPTVSKFFHDPDSVRKSTRERIEAALEQYNYRPNIYAVNQNRRMTKNFGIVVPYLADPFFAEIARNIEELVIAAGYRPILMSSHGEPANEVENLDALRAIKPAGVLLAPLGRASDRDAVAAFCRDVPTVHFDSNIEGMGDVFVGHDNDHATALMVDYLARTGEPPAFFEMRTPTNPNAGKRRRAYIATMERLGHEPQIVQVEGQDWEFERIGYEGGLRVLSDRSLATDTVFCSNDRLAIGFLAAAFEKGLRVGRGEGSALRVAGHDNHPFTRYTCPTLTTVAQNYRAISRKSVEEMLALIESDERPATRETTLFDGELIVRASA
ncbi:transcriptional regulator [Pseudooceanicola batsensis HTCC2597]|uniref:Transcriptional regulator n=1 Tax=Pseudooceanicola batsensis (strain ATCC BAA-863 / DSM 15984 / KCTC 12145 / HTCC2597) TaxID=252305 RepID=A3TT59_PSEBH|nr:LacI family DNA-binding transcriptional regulator [Pseudooceanicola batsensis]EAQ04836.1 transcriptional regulator [Pseudooceanicola batsensis HTCC2597]